MLILAATGCNKIGGLVSKEPTADDCRKVIENFTSSYLQILELEKIRAYEKMEAGNSICYVDVKVKYKFVPYKGNWVDQPMWAFMELSPMENLAPMENP